MRIMEYENNYETSENGRTLDSCKMSVLIDGASIEEVVLLGRVCRREGIDVTFNSFNDGFQPRLYIQLTAWEARLAFQEAWKDTHTFQVMMSILVEDDERWSYDREHEERWRGRSEKLSEKVQEPDLKNNCPCCGRELDNA